MLLIAHIFLCCSFPFQQGAKKKTKNNPKTPPKKQTNKKNLKKTSGTTTCLFVVSHYVNNLWGRIIRWGLGHETGYECPVLLWSWYDTHEVSLTLFFGQKLPTVLSSFFYCQMLWFYGNDSTDLKGIKLVL